MRHLAGSAVRLSRGRREKADGTSRGAIRRAFGGLLAACLMAGGLLGAVSSVASATTSAFTLTMTSGSFGVHGNTPTALPTPASIAGHVSSTTGSITSATLTIPSWHESNTGSTETIHIYEGTSGSGHGSINSSGAVTYEDTLTIQVHITSPITEKCTSSPVSVILASSSPYNTTTKDVTLTQSNFTIPNFSSSTCSLARSNLDSEFAGSSGNVLTLNLHGTLPEPPPPTTATTTTLSATPASPQLQATAVTFKATVKKTGTLETAATGTMNFYRTGTSSPLGTQIVTSGTASFTTTTLPGGTNELHAVYSGNSHYAGSTSSTLSYSIEPTPTISLSLPASVTTGAAPTQFSLKVTNPASGQSWTNLILVLDLEGITQAGVTPPVLSYKDSGGNWCSLGISGSSSVTGIFFGLGTPPCGGATGFSLAAGHSLTLPLEVSYSAANRVGVQTFTATLYTYTATSGTLVAPLTGTLAPRAHGTYTVNPASKYTPTVTAAALPTYSVPKGFVVKPQVTVAPPATPTLLPTPTGTLQFLVTTVVLASYPYNSNLANSATFSTSTLTTGTHTFKAKYLGDHVYNTASYSHTFTVGAAPSGTAATCVFRPAIGTTVTLNAAVTASSSALPSTNYTGSITVTGLAVTLTYDNYVAIVSPQASDAVGLSPGGVATASSATPSVTNDTGTVSWSGLTATHVPISGALTSEVSVGVHTIDLTWKGLGTTTLTYNCTTSSPVHLGTVKVVAPPTPVTWSVSGCTTGSTTAPSWANTEKVVAKGAGGGGGGAAASATGWGGRGGAGGSVTSTFTIAGSSTVSAKTGCAGKGAPQGGGVVGNGGASVSGWSASGAGGQGRYTAIGIAKGNDGTGGSGGGSTGVCNGASTCTSATTAHVVTVAAGGGGGGESMCSGTDAGNGGIAGNAGTTATSSSKGKGLSGTAGTPGAAWAITGDGIAGGPGGANNKSTGSGSAAGSVGGQGKEPVAGDGGGSGGGGAGYIGGAGGAPTADDCTMAGGGGGGSSWVASAGGSTTFGTGAAGSNRSGSTGTAGSVTVTFSYTKTR